MSHKWQSGDFDRQRLSGTVRHFAPAHAADSLVQIDLQRLWDRGKRLLLLDVDNTLVQWRGEEFAPEVIEWVERAKSMGFEICIISNTRKEVRLARLSELLGVQTVRGRFKPSRAMFRLALIKFQRKPEEAVMVGDQMMTDVLGANRSGIDAIWVRKMEGQEFKGTKINRAIERFLTGHVYEALISPVDEAPGPEPKRTLINQIIRFGIVGGTSFAVNAAIRWFLMFKVPYGNERFSVEAGDWLQGHVGWPFTLFSKPSDAFFPIACAVAATFAILNSFIWNRSWTFEIRGKAQRAAQLRRFFLVSWIGALLDLMISSFLNHVIGGQENRSVMLATIFSAAIVAVWNFIGQRFFAFRATKT